MKKNRIRLTESQLHRVIKESVKRVLREAKNQDTNYFHQRYDNYLNQGYGKDEAHDEAVYDAMCNGDRKRDSRHPLLTKNSEESWIDKSTDAFLDSKESDWWGKNFPDGVDATQERHIDDDGHEWYEDRFPDYPIKYRPSRETYKKYMNQKGYPLMASNSDGGRNPYVGSTPPYKNAEKYRNGELEWTPNGWEQKH